MHYRKKYLILLAALFLLVRHMAAQEDKAVRESADSVLVAPDSVNYQPGNSEPGFNPVPDNNSVETISFRLYTNKQWLQLAAYCEQAFNRKMDYYYLRVRAGVAFFELGQYRKAIIHFKKALAYNKGDDFASSYLYYAYLYSERFEDAKNLTRSFSAELTKSMGITSLSPVDFVTMESGIKAPDSSRQFKSALFSNISLNHSIGKRFFLLHSLTYFSQNEQRFSVRQLQYYVKGTLPLKNDFLLSAGFHLVSVNADVRSYVNSAYTHTYLVTPPPVHNASVQPQPFVTSVTDSISTEHITNKLDQNYIVALTLTKKTLYADYSIGLTSSRFDTTRQFQLGLGINIYPFKNNRFAFGGTIYLHSEKENKNNIALAPTLSAYLSKKFHLSAAYFINNGPNISENTGSFVSNSVDYTTNRISFTCSYSLASNLWLYGTYGYEQKIHRIEGYGYDYNIFVLGIKIIPGLK